MRGSRLPLALLLSGALGLLALLPVTAAASARRPAASSLRIVARAGGAVAVFGGHPRGGVLFVLNGVAIARDRQAPYRLRLWLGASRRGGRARAYRLVVRGFVSGRALAAARFVIRGGRVVAARQRLTQGRHAAAAASIWVTSAPGDVTAARTAFIAWVVSAHGRARVACSLDGARPRRCASPLRLTRLRKGGHRLSVVLHTAGGVAVTGASWRVVGPGSQRVAIVDRAGSSPSAVALFSFVARRGARTMCALDAGAAVACTSPVGYTALARGRHVFAVRADGAVAYAGWDVLAAPTSVPPPPPPPTGGGSPCGTAASAPATYDHVIWVVMENHGYNEALDPQQAPYTTGLAAKCGLATQFFAESHPSLPNYIAMTSGSTQGITDDADPSSHPLSVPSIFSQTGGDWRALEESMPSNCAQSDAGDYAVRHNPAAYYTNISAQCAARDVPLAATADLAARFTFVTPNVKSDTHDTSVGYGDTWLSTFLPKVFASSQYRAGRTAVFLTWDEDDGSAGNHIATLVIAPSVHPGTRVATSFSHYSLLRTTEEMLGITTHLGGAASANSMRAGFHA